MDGNDSQAPTVEMIEAELEREQRKRNHRRALRSAVYVLIIVAAATVVAVVLLFPMLQITGTSMTDTLQDGDIVIALKGAGYKEGDIVAFHYNNKILVKRVIATAGDWVDIDVDGYVSVNGELLNEPYIAERALGYCDIVMPCQVPDGRYFLMGDNRNTSMDSRDSEIGCISNDMIIGKIKFCVWPLADLGLVN